MKKILIASCQSEAEELRRALEGAKYQVDLTLPAQAETMKRHNYDFVITDAEREGEVLKNGNIELNPTAYTVLRNKKAIKVTPLEFRIIKHFIEHRGEVVTRESLTKNCWNTAAGASRNTIEVYIKRIRTKLGANTVRTVHGIGYQMDKR